MAGLDFFILENGNRNPGDAKSTKQAGLGLEFQ